MLNLKHERYRIAFPPPPPTHTFLFQKPFERAKFIVRRCNDVFDADVDVYGVVVAVVVDVDKVEKLFHCHVSF